MPAAADRPQVFVETRAQWRAWLAANHSQAGGIWLVINKKTSGRPHLHYDDLVEEALCFGWIDSVPRKHPADDTKTMVYLSPRKPTSHWSKVNKARLDKLEANGMMTPAGQVAVARAKANGSWTFLDDVEAGHLPLDLEDALAAYPKAMVHFNAFPHYVKKWQLMWIKTAKTDATRAKRVAAVAEAAQRNQPAYGNKTP